MAKHKSKRMQRIQAPTQVFAQSRRAFSPPWQCRGSAERMVLEPTMAAVVGLTEDAGTCVTSGLFLTPGHSHGSASGRGRLYSDLREMSSNARLPIWVSRNYIRNVTNSLVSCGNSQSPFAKLYKIIQYYSILFNIIQS